MTTRLELQNHDDGVVAASVAVESDRSPELGSVQTNLGSSWS